MWIYSDPVEWAKLEDLAWDAERARAAQRRLLDQGKQPASPHLLLGWAHNVLEHMFSIVGPGRGSKPMARPLSMSDVEVARLLALVVPSVDVIPLEHPAARTESPEEEACASGF